MSIKVGTKNINSIPAGNKIINRVFAGNKRVYDRFNTPIDTYASIVDSFGNDGQAAKDMYNSFPELIRTQASVILMPFTVANGKVLAMDNSSGELIRFDFSRPSDATLFNSELDLQIVTSNMPRIDFGNYTKETKILIENESTNIALYSNFDSVGQIISDQYSLISDDWLGKLSTINKSIKLVKPTSNFSFLYRSGITRIIGNKYSVSTFCRVEDGSEIILGSNAYPVNGDANFNPHPDSTIIKPVKLDNLNNGIYRSKMTSVATSTAGYFGYAKNSTSLDRNMYFSGIQHEEGDIVTSYIPTKETIATRSADLLSYTLLNNCSVYLNTTKQKTVLDKQAGVWNIHEDLSNEGIYTLAIFDRILNDEEKEELI